ncbi:MAG TPA: pyridine nucleotide-disulfide oxidoreductase [Lapillicoccus sp.]|nr:pyridine nucleotide-disulfide oxidoreductase [Lapillicoccus sp.]
MTTFVDVDYLVVGAGAAGMGFVDPLVDHSEARVALVDRREAAGGHWLADYPFVRLHQASSFYGVASTVLGDGRLQSTGPEAGWSERADQPTICAYFAEALDRMVATGRVEFFPGTEYRGDRTFVSRETGERYTVPERCRIVDGTYLSPDIPAEEPPPFAVDGATVVPVNDVTRLEDGFRQYVIVGSGKTATDAIVRLLTDGVEPDAICWVRPRDPWMLNRAHIQPNPETYLDTVARLLRCAAETESLDDAFLGLEQAGIMLRIDRSVMPTMARAPTLGLWELELLRSIDNVVRLGHVTAARRGWIDLDDGSVRVAEDCVVVNCAADGLKIRERVPIWGTDAITLQPVRAGFPCFGFALTGYVEATRNDDGEKNRVCRSSSFGNTGTDWAAMNAVGMRNSAAFSAEPDLDDFANRIAVNPARVPPGYPGSVALDDARARIGRYAGPALDNLTAWAGLAG